MSETVEVGRDDLDTVLEYVAQEATAYPGIPDDVDESAQALEETLYGKEDC